METVRKPPAEWYRSQEVFDAEQRNVFNVFGELAGEAVMVRAPGTYYVPRNVSTPTVVTRDKEGTLRAFHNVCLHHKVEVARAHVGLSNKLSCPYHGWTYGLDGKLRGTPHLKEKPPCLQEGLQEMGVGVWGPLLFVHPTENVPMVWENHSGIGGHDFEWGNLTWATNREYTLQCNWKVYVENYLDGGYHVPVLHKNLTKQLDLSTYKVEVGRNWVLQYVDGGTGDFQGRIGDKALYMWLYPNIMINRYGPWMTTISVIPLSVNETKVSVDYYIEKDYTIGSFELDYNEFVCKSIEASVQVTEEDIAICESAQRGLNSPVDFRGTYVPKFEKGMYYFHQLIKEALKEN